MHLKRPCNSIYGPHYLLLHCPAIVEKIVLITPLPYASTTNACSHPRPGTNFSPARLCYGWKDAEPVGFCCSDWPHYITDCSPDRKVLQILLCRSLAPRIGFNSFLQRSPASSVGILHQWNPLQPLKPSLLVNRVVRYLDDSYAYGMQ